MDVKAVKVQDPMSPIRSAEPRSASAGFMLIDVALAIALVLLVAAVVWPMAGRGTSRAEQTAAALDIATLLRVDRASASREGRPKETRVDLALRTVTGTTGRQVRVPRDVTVEVTTSPQCTEGP